MVAALPALAVHTPLPQASGGAFVRAYHHRTKHRVSAFAQGPETLDWDAQPAPFRNYAGAPRLALPLLEERAMTTAVHAALKRPFAWPIEAGARVPWSLATLGALLQCSLAITAYKSLGPDRWAVRANPSSGNLHPVEAYVLSAGMPFLKDGIYHYAADTHSLERLADWSPAPGGRGLFLGLSTVPWRETWKYGERAFRYCQLDVGHAMAALGVAAAALGAAICEVPISSAPLARLLGTQRLPHEPPTETEEAEVLLRLELAGLDVPHAAEDLPDEGLLEVRIRWEELSPSKIDAHPLYRWPIIERVALETRQVLSPQPPAIALEAHRVRREALRVQPSRRALGDVVLGRRSARRYDIRHTLSAGSFLSVITTMRQATEGAHRIQPWPSRLDVVMLVHRVEGLAPGLYFLERAGAELEGLRKHLRAHFQSTRVAGELGQLGLWKLRDSGARDLMRFARRMHCGQDIAASACLTFAMLAPTTQAFGVLPSDYRRLHREAGQVGHALYLQAEAEGLRGTGIGCFLDDEIHALLGLEGDGFQSLYHFALGKPLMDARIEDHPAYADRRGG